MAMRVLGIDIGGSGIKAAPVDVTTGKLLADRQKFETPRPALPDPVADVVKQLTTAFSWSGPIGITFPGVVTPSVTTPGKVMPTGPDQLKEVVSLFTTSATGPGRAGRGVSIFSRSARSLPVVTSTGAALMPEPPMSMPSACMAIEYS